MQPLPEDFDLFSEVDLVLTQIRQCYMEIDKFWRDEIYHVAKVLELRRVDASDLDRWENFQASLKETIESWKVWSLLPLLHIPISQNTLVRMSHQMAIPKLYAATIHALLRFAQSSIYFGVPNFRPTMFREMTSGQLPRPYRRQ